MKKIKPRRKSLLILLLVTGIAAISVLALGSKNLNKNENIGDGISNNDDIPTEVMCTRTTRLENLPTYDRALSLIGERYRVWEEGKNNFGTYYFFPSQLTNCIKVVEGDVKSTTQTEGYFAFNNVEIKDNYFPITIDKTYSDSDYITNALLLVHEITHVRQYIDSLNGEKELSCIDKEVEAFDAALSFASYQYGEDRKLIDLRLKHDDNLNPQLQTLKAISEHYWNNSVSVTEICNGDFGESCGGKITANRRGKIKDLVSQDDLYRKQCELY